MIPEKNNNSMFGEADMVPITHEEIKKYVKNDNIIIYPHCGKIIKVG